jgi:PAS domain S-box-containing protein
MDNDMLKRANFADYIVRNPWKWQILITFTTLFILILNLYSLNLGVSSVTNQLLYIPIIITAYAYPRKGTWFALGIASVYLFMVYAIRGQYPTEILAAITRFYMFVFVGVVVSYLSFRIKKEEQKYIRIFEQSYTGVLLLNPETLSIIQANHHMEDTLGYSAEEITSTPVSAFFRESDLTALEKIFGKVKENPAHLESFQVSAIKNGGSEITVNISISGVQDENKDLEFIVLVLHDITKRRSAELVIQQQAAAMNISMDGMAIVSPTGELVYLNDAMATTFGSKSPQNLLGRKWDRLFSREEWIRFSEKILPDLALHGHWRGEMTGRDTEGSGIPVEISLGMTEEGGIFCSVHDITERKLQETALRQVNAKLNLVASITRHDIRNQIFTLRAFLDIIKDTERNDTKYPYLEEITQGIRLISERIEFTKVYKEMGLSPPQWQDLNLVFLYAISHIDLAGISRSVEVSGISLLADPMLERAFFNMIEAVVHHAGGSTEIRFTRRGSEPGLTLVYEDNGVGVPANMKERIFDSESGLNWGLGLFLTREILAITGMTIHERGEPGKGTRFEITVPKGLWRVEGE